MPDSMVTPMMQLLSGRYDVVVIGVHKYNRFPGNNFGISTAASNLIPRMQDRLRTITMVFGNPYVLANLCDSKILVECYEDDNIMQQTAADLLAGRFVAKGKLPVSVCPSLHYGAGIVKSSLMPAARPFDVGFRARELSSIDS